MGLSAYVLRTLAQVKALVPITGTGLDTLYEECVNEASRMVEDAWGRHIVTRGSLTEFHPKSPGCSSQGHELFTIEWPIISVTSIHEDPARGYASSTLLVEGTDYIVSKPAGKLIRIASALPVGWVSSWRAEKVVYAGGYQVVNGTAVAGATEIPEGILQVFDELVSWMIRWRAKREVGLQSVSDETGSRTFVGPPIVTDGQQATLARAGAMPGYLRGPTGERDS